MTASRSSQRRPAPGPDDPRERSPRPATATSRAAAYLLDAALVGPALLALTRRWSGGRRLLAIVAGATAYHAVLEGATGLTAGKRAVGIAVRPADDGGSGEGHAPVDGGPPGFRAATVRTLWRFVDWLPAGYLLGFLAIETSSRRQRLGDRAAGTVVVERERAGSSGANRE